MLPLKMKITKGDRTRQFIIERMSSVLSNKGVWGTSISEIQLQTGLSRGAIYGNFESKEEIALAVFDYNFEKICALVERKLRKAESFHAKIMVFAKLYQSISSDLIFTGGSPILNNAWEAEDANALLKLKAMQAIQTVENKVSGLVASGIHAGEFRKGVDPGHLATGIVSAIEGGLRLSRITGDQSRMDAIVSIIDTLLQSIAN